MCLTSRRKTAKVATEDIVVYKVLINRKGGLVSPFQLKPYTLGITEDNTETMVTPQQNSKNYIVSKGLLHSFMYEKEATDCMLYLNVTFGEKHCICKCIIPKGTPYYEGMGSMGYSFASKKLNLVEII